MRYEPAEKKQCLGYWVNPMDWAEWTFEVTEPGIYEVELWQGCGKGQGGSDVQVKVNGEKFAFVVEETGNFQNFVPRRVGKIKFASPGSYSLEVRPQNKKAGAIMDVQRDETCADRQALGCLSVNFCTRYTANCSGTMVW